MFRVLVSFWNMGGGGQGEACNSGNCVVGQPVGAAPIYSRDPVYDSGLFCCAPDRTYYDSVLGQCASYGRHERICHEDGSCNLIGVWCTSEDRCCRGDEYWQDNACGEYGECLITCNPQTIADRSCIGPSANYCAISTDFCCDNWPLPSGTNLDMCVANNNACFIHLTNGQTVACSL